jgi:hypothetical protein
MSWVKRAAIVGVVAFLVGTAFSATLVEAQSPYLHTVYSPDDWGWGYTGYVREHVPYFAMNPPVYYSYPVARAYGFSPYAYLPYTRTPELAPLRPAVFQNPYVAGFSGEGPYAEQPRVKPFRARNPYFDEPSARSAPAKGPASPAVKPAKPAIDAKE